MIRGTLAKRLRQLGMTSVCVTLGVAVTGCFGNDQKLLGAPGIPQPYLAPPEQTSVIESAPAASSRTEIISIGEAPRQPAPQPQAPTIYTPPPAAPSIIDEGPSATLEPPVMLPPKASTPPPLPDPPKSNTLTYTVKKGDTLWEIGRMYGVTSKEIAAFNNRDVNAILPIGLVLKLPPGAKYVPPSERPTIKKKDERAPAPRRTNPKSTSDLVPPRNTTRAAATASSSLDHKYKGSQPIPSNGKYTVAKGDNLWEIAKRFGLSVREIMDMNNLKDNTIFPSQTLVLRSGSATNVQSTPPPAPAPSTPAATSPSPDKPVLPAATKAETPAETDAAVDVSSLKQLPHYCTAGDTLESIAEMYKSEVDWIINVNDKISGNADIKDGVKVMVPIKPAD